MKSRIVMAFAAALAAAAFGIGLCNGCASGGAEQTAARAAVRKEVAALMRLAYDVGARDAVSNRIERLVADGKVTEAQASYIHAAAQAVYERTLERMEADAPAPSAPEVDCEKFLDL